ncbi:PREDICTED: putative nuclease HARBI1 [Camelina sativa]|uniref:Nuclease HARBI1 n=1 Tax=Camelina sativa TaxID=90675 RepID=A0ABM0X4L4_CAMSA|nr:PREDICTED: putative nuclease HARBI1 [Camelina sativa]
MDPIVHESEEIQARKTRKRKRNFKLDIDIMMLVLSIIAKIQHSVLQIPRQIRKSATRLGHEYIQYQLVHEKRDTFRRLYRMDPEAFLNLCSILRLEMGLKDTRYVSVEEMLATFLFIVGQNSRYVSAETRFQRSRFSISKSFNKILKVLKALAPKYMAKPGLAVPTKIKDSTRFYPYFKDCVGAIDGTHILAMITGQDLASYRNRKGQLSQNVLAACNFDLEFTYVLSGWEGSAHDAKVLNDALTRNTNKLIVPEGKYYLVDCGFANHRQFLAPFRSTRYHLQDFRGQGKDPANANELFNHPHSSLRNVIERIFGIFKSRFLIFKYAPPFPYKTQVELVLACVVLHNYLRRECRSDLFEDVANAEGTAVDERVDDENHEEEQLHGTQDQQRVLANNWRATIAENMWTDAMNMGS